MSNNIYGIDFGTCNFKVFSKSSGKVVSEKNTIAIINKTQIYAYGDDAYAMFGKILLKAFQSHYYSYLVFSLL